MAAFPKSLSMLQSSVIIASQRHTREAATKRAFFVRGWD
jgi:hypothetical protein